MERLVEPSYERTNRGKPWFCYRVVVAVLPRSRGVAEYAHFFGGEERFTHLARCRSCNWTSRTRRGVVEPWRPWSRGAEEPRRRW
jgi:hypothetical protein